MFLNLALACLFPLAIPIVGSPVTRAEYRLDTSQIEAVRNAARLWVQAKRLPPSDTPQSAADEARFADAWAQFGVACRHVEEAWARAFKADPLFERAAECLDRLVELEWQFNMLRNDIRSQFGNDGFREFEGRGRAWVEANGKPWLDLDDANLVRLYLRAEFLAHARDEIEDGNIPSLSYEWMKTTEPYACEVSGGNEQLTEERAIEICRATIRRLRNVAHDEQEKLTARLDLPPKMWRYLEIRAEADYLAFLGETYPGVHLAKHQDIAKAEAEFHFALEQVTAIRPDAMQSLQAAHKKHLDELVQEKTRQYEAFQASLRGERRERD